MVRFLDYTLDYFTGQLIFRLPVDVSDEEFNPNVIVVDYETAEDVERNITFGGRVQTQVLNDKVQIGSTFVHEDGSSWQGGAEQIKSVLMSLHRLQKILKFGLNMRLRKIKGP